MIYMRFKILTAQTLILSLLITGCSTFVKESKTEPVGITPINKSLSEIQILSLGSKVSNTDDIIDEINKKTVAALNTKISIEFSSSQELSNKIKTKISSGQKLDIVVNQSSVYKQMVAEGKYAQLDELLNKYGPQILKVRPKEMWNANKIDDKIMGIPVENTFKPANGTWYIRKDLREKLGFEEIRSNDDLIKFLYAVKNSEKDIIVSATINNLMYYPGQNRILISSKGKIRTTPAMDYSYILYFNGNDGKVHNMFDEKNPIIWNEYLNARKLYNDKITFENNLSYAKDKLNFLQDGKLAAYYGVIDINAMINLRNGLKQKIPSAEIETYTEPDPTENYIINFTVKNMVCIPESSKNKDRSIQFLNWGNQKENYNLILLGIEGVDWAADGTDKYKSMKNNHFLQTMMILVASPVNLMFNSNLSDAYINEYKKYQNPKNFTEDILTGFEFNTSNISKELQECLNLHNNNFSDIVNGSAETEQAWEVFKNSSYNVIKKIQLELQSPIDMYLKNK